MKADEGDLPVYGEGRGGDLRRGLWRRRVLLVSRRYVWLGMVLVSVAIWGGLLGIIVLWGW